MSKVFKMKKKKPNSDEFHGGHCKRKRKQKKEE